MKKTISVLIPTLNAGRVLEKCLRSIAEQDYPRELLQIIIADGGSTDDSLEIARKYADRIVPNPLKTGEAGKAAALRYATGEIVALIDSDNVLPSSDWLDRMVAPFEDPEIVGAEPLEYTWRQEDSFITRYCALMGMNDPLCFFLGNYDRHNLLSDRWTETPVEIEDAGDYLKVTLLPPKLPTIGANGFLIRREDLVRASVDDYLFDIDVVYELSLLKKDKYAKVKTGIVHLFSGDVLTFARKQDRRVRDYLYYQRANYRKYPWSRIERKRILKFVVYTALVFPLVAQSLRGCTRRWDTAWFFHPIACWLTLCVYGAGALRGLAGARFVDRKNWSQ